MELQGKCIVALPVESGTSKSGNAWQKRNFVIETAGQYPKKMCMQLFGDKVNECPNVGEEVKVSFDVESREWNGRWFTQLNVWKVERQGAQAAQQPVYQQAQPQAPATTAAPQADDLPF